MYSISLLGRIAAASCLASGLLAQAQAAVLPNECDPQQEVVQRIDDVANNDTKLTCRAYNQYQIGSITAATTANVEFIAGESILINGELQVLEGAILALNVELIPWDINDTGATNCTTANEQNIDCPVSGFPDQDGLFGRDLWHYEPADGHAGFSYTKLDNSGNSLLADAQTWDCVYDNVTGLMWEKKTTDGGLRDMRNTYSWYNMDPDLNAGNAGTLNGGACTGNILCDTEAYTDEINRLGLCGKNNWRVPTLPELQGIVRSGDIGGDDNFKPAFESTYFPNTNYNQDSPGTPGENSYWSNKVKTDTDGIAHAVDFADGESDHQNSDRPNYLRLVHEGQQ